MSTMPPPDWFVVKVYPPYVATSIRFNTVFGWYQGFFYGGNGANLYSSFGDSGSVVVSVTGAAKLEYFDGFESAARYVEAQMALGILGERE